MTDAQNTPLVINIDTGVITFRTAENANHCNCRPISRKHAEMVEKGELEIGPLLSAIKRHMMSREGFDYDKYALERRSLNVRRSALHGDERQSVDDAPKEDYLSDCEISEESESIGDPVSDAVCETRQKTGRQKKSEKSDSSEKKGDSDGQSGMPDCLK